MAEARAIFGRVACAVGLAVSIAPHAWSQAIISAHSGIIHYVEGEITLDGNAVHPKFAEFPDVKAGQLLAAGEGRAEILLTPGVFLRMAENSSVRMLSNSLADTRLEVVSGSVLVEVGELLDHNAVSFETAGARMELAKKGLYRIDASPAGLRVFEGQARVTAGSDNLTARKGHRIDLAATKLSDTRFETKDTDAFYRWSSRRAEYVAAANVISARVSSNSDYGSSFSGNPGAWSWNPYFGMFTFLPASGVYWSPFGAPFYSPGMAWAAYVPRRGVSAAPGFGGPVEMGGSAASFERGIGDRGIGNRGGTGMLGGSLGGGGRMGASSQGSAPSPGARASGPRGH